MCKALHFCDDVLYFAGEGLNGGERWAYAREVAIREVMAALYHALGTSRILAGVAGRRGLVEAQIGVCGGGSG